RIALLHRDRTADGDDHLRDAVAIEVPDELFELCAHPTPSYRGMVPAQMAEPLETDYLVIGSGIAGLNFALLAAEHGRVVVVTKKKLADTNTNWAQGGVAAVLASEDSFAQHVQDTITAGDGLCDRDVVEMCVAAGPAQVQ